MAADPNQAVALGTGVDVSRVHVLQHRLGFDAPLTNVCRFGAHLVNQFENHSDAQVNGVPILKYYGYDGYNKWEARAQHASSIDADLYRSKQCPYGKSGAHLCTLQMCVAVPVRAAAHVPDVVRHVQPCLPCDRLHACSCSATSSSSSSPSSCSRGPPSSSSASSSGDHAAPPHGRASCATAVKRRRGASSRRRVRRWRPERRCVRMRIELRAVFSGGRWHCHWQAVAASTYAAKRSASDSLCSEPE
jgi:hypothetical protein